MIIITGGTGRVGSSLVRRLAGQGAPLRVMARDGAKAGALLPAVDVVVGDLDQPASLPAAFAGGTSLFLLTPQSPRQADQELAAIEAARQVGVDHIVKVSACNAAVSDGSPTPVGRAHARAEAALLASGMSWTLLRPGAFMQVALAPLLAQAKAKGKILLPLGRAKVSFIDVRDIARAAAWALTNPRSAAGRTLTLTGPEALGLSDVAQRLSLHLGRPVKASSPPEWLARLALRKMAPDPFLRSHQAAMLGLMRAGLLAQVSDDLASTTGLEGRSVGDWLRSTEARP